MKLFGQLLLVLWLCASMPTQAGEVLVAVAANFTGAAQEIATAFQDQTGHQATLSFGSSGQLYAQITQQAPFEVFLSADQARPQRAVEEGLAVADSRFTYATGKLVLWSAEEGLALDASALSGEFSRLAIANPTTAPYGAAAVQVLERLGLYEHLQDRLVLGNNINQSYQFVYTGNAELGLVALSQLSQSEIAGSRWEVPEDLYAPILQDAVLLSIGAENPVAQGFLAYLRSEAARHIIQRHGYGLVD